METIIRQQYIDEVEKSLGQQTIIILVGQRRVGKSVLLKQLQERKGQETNANVIYIDKEKSEFDHIKTYRELNTYVAEHFQTGHHNYVMIDEAQDIQEFERSVRSLRTEPDTDVIITGSNARMMSSELSTLLGGRYKEIHIQALSYSEFLTFHHIEDSDEALTLYINYGGMPGLIHTGLNEEETRKYQLSIYETALLKDVIMHNSVRNVAFLYNFTRFVADNVGKLISANSISKYMKSQGQTVTTTAIINYLRYLTEAYIIHRVNRYDIHGRRILEMNDKYYFQDIGIRNAISGGTREGDIEKVMENVVYQQLTRLGYKVYVGQLQAGEIDFVCIKPDGSRAYVQVAYVVADEQTRKREFGNLQNIRDSYPKYVVSMTPLLSQNDCNGITHLPLRHFLTQGLR